MPLKNRLEEVIKRYEKASTLVQSYKEGHINEEDLGQGFKTLRKQRKEVDDHNRNYIRQQRQLYMGDDGSNEGADEEQVEAETVSSNTVEDNDDDDQEEYEEDDDEGVDMDIDAQGNGEAAGEDAGHEQDPEERRLWRQYGSFWQS